jgi:hypothetical protein
MVSKQTTQRRRRNSKRQKRRSLKRRNVKSRKVMRGGAPDPLENVKVGDWVHLEITPTPNAYSEMMKKHRESVPTIPNPTYALIVCKVLSVTPPTGYTQKIVKLKITKGDDKIELCSPMGTKLETENSCSEEFEIMYNPDSASLASLCPYYFKNIVKSKTYKYVNELNKPMNLLNPWFIINVQAITASQ